MPTCPMAYSVKSDQGASTPIAAPEPNRHDGTKVTPKQIDTSDRVTALRKILDALGKLAELVKSIPQARASARASVASKPVDPAKAMDFIWSENVNSVQAKYSGNRKYFEADFKYQYGGK